MEEQAAQLKMYPSPEIHYTHQQKYPHTRRHHRVAREQNSRQILIRQLRQLNAVLQIVPYNEQLAPVTSSTDQPERHAHQTNPSLTALTTQ